MKAKARKILALLLCVLMLAGTMVTTVAASSTADSVGSSSASMDDVADILNAISYSEYIKKYADEEKGSKELTAEFLGATASVKVLNNYYGEDNVLLIPEVGSVTWKVDVPKDALYAIQIEYCQYEGKTNSIERVFYLNGAVPFSGARSVILSKTWKYDYHKDANGNETFEQKGEEGFENDVRPSVSENPTWNTYLITDSSGYYNYPYEFFFSKGENTITLEGSRESAVIKSIKLIPVEEQISYEDYLKLYPDNAQAGVIEKIEAEHTTNVSNVTVYPVHDRTSPITSGLTGPQSAKVTKYNTIGGAQWQNVGEWVEYEIEVPKGASGYYGIAFRYKQNLLSGMFVSRRVYIDGEIPFDEANYCTFNFSDNWDVKYLGNGDEEYKFYLSEGKHTIRFEAVLGDMGYQVQEVSESLTVINNCYLEILKLTGSTPDEDRTYGFARVMPDVIAALMEESIRLKEVYTYLTETTGLKGQQTATLQQLYNLLHKMASDEKEIAKNLETLKSQIGNLGTWINTAKTQPLQVDYIQIQKVDEELPKSDGNFFQSIWYEIKLFWWSFFIDYSSGGTDNAGSEEDAVEVWITTVANTTGRDQAQIVRNLIENDFKPKTDIAASVKLVAAGTLLPSVLAGVGPDVSLFENSTSIIDYALRSAAMSLNSFIEQDLAKGTDVLSWFPDAAMIPLTLYNYDAETDTMSETYYGLPDKLDFPMMFYRKDILTSLGLEIPKTWDDLLAMIPILQYNNMEIGIMKDIYTFIHQSGNTVYSNNGMTINFDNVGVLNAFTKLCNMFTQYSLPYQYDFANRFRTGEMPIGIASYGMCNQLEVFATEISGLWGFVPLPGYEVVDENGQVTINNTANATVSGCLMLSGCENPDNAWEFMKWYTGKDFQVNYSNEIVALMGISARPMIANTEAIYELPWTNEEAQNISAQMESLNAAPNMPGSYYLQRYIDFAFLAAYNDGADPADALMGYVGTINKELTRKRLEFGMDVIED